MHRLSLANWTFSEIPHQFFLQVHQWYARLVNAFATEIGVYYGGEKNILPITVTTYSSSGDLIASSGNTFKLIIFDEVHHLPPPQWGETALMAPSPLRLRLPATYPPQSKQTTRPSPPHPL